MTILHETNEQSNYAAERVGARLSPATVEQAKSIAVGQQEIDPNCSGETAGYHGWLHRVKRQSSEATVADILTLEGRYQETAQRLATEESNHDTTKRLLRDGETREIELDQGCEWLAEALDKTEGQLQERRFRYFSIAQGLNDLVRRCQDAEAVIDGLCNHDPDVVSVLYFSSQKRKAAEREVSRLEAKCEQIELAYSDVCDELEAGAKRGNELADLIRALAACDQANGFENPVIEMPAELYQRLMRVAAELGVK